MTWPRQLEFKRRSLGDLALLARGGFAELNVRAPPTKVPAQEGVRNVNDAPVLSCPAGSAVHRGVPR